ncbi:S8 family serine peptidase, partial [Candidatus Woesearchaeota archaeon]|nr:S8 family serine peptidase [Candidatus Woesearchaeota archaeon]
MKVDRWLILVLIVLLLASVLAVSAQEDPDEYVDVIVNLKEKGKQQFKANSFGQMSKEFREQFKESRKQDIRQAQSEFFDNVQIQDKQVKHVYSNINTVVMRIKKSEMHLLESDPNVDSFDTGVKFDSFLTNSVPLVEANTVHGTQYGGMNLTGTGEVVCVVDTGIDYTHSEFGSCTQGQMTSGTCAKVPGGYDYVNNDNDPADDRGHGTHVSGIVAAAGPIKGVAPGANIIAMKSLNENGSDPTGAWVIAGIDYCVNNSATYNISAISLSLGTYEFNNTPCDNDNRATMVAIKNAIDAAQGLG